MAATALHHCRVLSSPWPGVYGVQTDSARHFGRHWHGTFGIGLLEQGAQRSASGRGAVEAFAGDLITSNPGEVHDGRPLGEASRRWHMVHLDPAVIAAMAAPGRSLLDVEWTRPVIQDASLRAALQRLLRQMDHWSAGRSVTDADRLACEESLAETCGLLLDHHSTATPAEDTSGDVAQVRERLADEVLDPPTLAELAAMAGLSRYQLLRRFTQAYGVPPHAWLLQQRVERARRLIRDGNDLVTAALAAGFADQSHMTRLFGRHFGFTPGAWQRVAARKRSQ
ncbi:MAG: AraC family transcriptional regulator [Burkholderiaceae bacterium]|nr:AraC family transcriptional regulator [Burkholderiaceae bacterium]